MYGGICNDIFLSAGDVYAWTAQHNGFAGNKSGYAAFADMDFQDKARNDKYSNKQRIAAADKYIEYQKRFRISNREAKKAAKRYELQKIISFPERTISKGIVAIANLLSKLGRKK